MCYVECVSLGMQICIPKQSVLFVFIVYIVHVFVCVMHVCGFNKLLVYKLDVIWGEPQTSDWSIYCVCLHLLQTSSEQIFRFYIHIHMHFKMNAIRCSY